MKNIVVQNDLLSVDNGIGGYIVDSKNIKELAINSSKDDFSIILGQNQKNITTSSFSENYDEKIEQLENELLLNIKENKKDLQKITSLVSNLYYRIVENKS